MIHPSAIVECSLPKSVEVGAFSYVGANVELGEKSVIGSHCVIGSNESSSTVIGDHAMIRSHTVIYSNVKIGERLETGHHVTIREKTVAGVNLRIGTQSDVQGDVSFGDYVRLHSSVHIGKFSKVGNFVWIFPYTVLTNDPHPPSESGLRGPVLEDFSIVATQCCLLPGVRIGRHAMVGAGSTVSKDVPDGYLAIGSPAKAVREMESLLDKDGRRLYPWTTRFSVGYPPSIVESWRS